MLTRVVGGANGDHRNTLYMRGNSGFWDTAAGHLLKTAGLLRPKENDIVLLEFNPYLASFGGNIQAFQKAVTSKCF